MQRSPKSFQRVSAHVGQHSELIKDVRTKTATIADHGQQDMFGPHRSASHLSCLLFRESENDMSAGCEAE